MSKKYGAASGPKVIKRVAIYNRVSTLRQLQNDLSMPDQSRQNHEFCSTRGYEIVDEVFEHGTATSDEHRPQFQVLIARALAKPAPFDAIIVHSMSRFFRDDVAQEYNRRKLQKNGVEVLSVTQDFGEGPMADLTRRILGIVDELNSKETAKHVKRTMVANAKAGWWTASKAPFGYEIEHVDSVGARKRRKLKEHPQNGPLVRLIFKLALEGDGKTGPLGIKKIVSYLTESGATYNGKGFYTSHVEHVLKNEGYTGTYYYNQSDSQKKMMRAREEWIPITVPQLVSPEDFQRLQVALNERAPRRIAPRILASPVLLTGVAKCGVCGGNMKIGTGTSRSGSVHRYYRCATRTQTGLCKPGARNTIKEGELDALAIQAVMGSLLTADRVKEIIARVCERRQEGREKGTKTLERLRYNLTRLTAAANNLLGALAEGVVGDSGLFRDKYQKTLEQRDQVQRLLEIEEQQLKDEIRPLSAEEGELAAARLRQRLAGAEKEVQKRLMRALIGEIVVFPDEIVIRGPEPALAETAFGAVGGQEFPLSAVHTSDREWRARQDSNL
ncbi:MAG: recombinase family protein [Pseudomonadota bacterium]